MRRARSVHNRRCGFGRGNGVRGRRDGGARYVGWGRFGR
jgi:hypothetical protein